MLTFALVLALTIGLSFLPERLLKPTVPKFNINNSTLQGVLISLIFLVLTLIVQRPIFSGLAILVFLIILIAVSNAKYKALKEPMVFSDFAMFAQAFKHPRLYFPFLGVIPVVVAPLLIGGLIYAVLSLEPAMPFTWLRVGITLLGIIIAYFISKKLSLNLELSKIPENDNHQFGLQNALYSYFIQSRIQSHKEEISRALKTSPFHIKENIKTDKSSSAERTWFTLSLSKGSTPPPFLADLCKSKSNITVIQSESFFDARRLDASIKTNVLKNFDTINSESVQYGKLSVPAWGANTMRTEFSFLTGLRFEEMGFYRYYPYQFLADFSVNSIASALSLQGYHCICIHPHPASFFGRDKIFPKMGFDEFIDINDFQDKETFGPYISDETVTKKIIEITEERINKPLFIYVITMENHGPLHLEKTTSDEYHQYYTKVKKSQTNIQLIKELNDLTVYLRHLKNADNMIKTLTDYYRQQDSEHNIETRLCFYGDHIPSMPSVYDQTKYTDDQSDYFIWHSNQTKTRHKPDNLPINIELLALALLKL